MPNDTPRARPNPRRRGQGNLGASRLCAHVFPEGRNCGQPALRGQAFCRYHQQDPEGRPEPTAPSLPPVVPEVPRVIPDRQAFDYAVAVSRPRGQVPDPTEQFVALLFDEERPIFERYWKSFWGEMELQGPADMMAVELVCVYLCHVRRCVFACDYENVERLDRMIQGHLKGLKATRMAREGETQNHRHVVGSPAEWAATLVQRHRQQLEAGITPNGLGLDVIDVVGDMSSREGDMLPGEDDDLATATGGEYEP